MTKEQITYLANSFCKNCCGDEKLTDCECRQVSCTRLVGFLMDVKLKQDKENG